MLYDDLYVFSKIYPFCSGAPSAESYLEHEIPYLAQRFQRVIVFSGWRDGDDCPVCSSFSDNGIAIRIPYIKAIRALPKCEKHDLLQSYIDPPCQEIVSDCSKITDSARLNSAARFMLYSDKFFELVTQAIADFGIELSGANSLVYSYWYTHHARCAILLADSILAKTGTRPKCFCRAHGHDLYSYRQKENYLPFQTWMANHLDAVFACSQDGVHHLQRENPTEYAKYQLGYLGTTLPEDIDSSDCRCLKPRHGGDGLFHVVCCSRAVPIKRVDRVIASLKILEDRGYRLKFTFMGNGECLPSLMEQSHMLGSTEVCFTGFLENESILRFYASESIDVFVNASEAEGLPLSIMEAQSMGIPVIATDVGGVSELVKDGVNGVLLNESFADEDMADAIERYIKMDRGAFDEARAASRKAWRDSFMLQNNAQRILDCMMTHEEKAE